MSTNRPKAFITIQPSLSHYRELLVWELLDSDAFDFELVGRYGGPDSGRASRPTDASDELQQQVTRVQRRQLPGKLSWDSGILSRVLRSKAVIFVFEGNVYNLSSWAAAIVAKMRGRKVVFWGHGWKRPEAGLKLGVRKFFYRLSDGHLVYGDRARDYAGKVGLRRESFFVVYNSFLSEAEIGRVEREVPTDLTGHDKPDLTVLFSGRLTRRHRADEAVAAVLRARRDMGVNIVLLLIGSGPEEEHLREKAAQDPVAVRFLGPVYDVGLLRRAYGLADLALSPGASGLNVIQAIGFGVPVIAADGNPDSGPEIEAVLDGKTGILYKPSEEKLDRLLARMVEPEAKAGLNAMSEEGVRLSLDRYSSERQAQAVVEALQVILTG